MSGALRPRSVGGSLVFVLGGALSLVVGAAACSSFSASEPLAEGGTATPEGGTVDPQDGGADALPDGPGLDCVPFSNDFSSGDLISNGFAEITGEVALASAAGKDGGGGLQARTTLAGNAEGGDYAERLFDLAAGTSFVSIDVSFDVFVGRPPDGVRLIAGCMLYARGGRNVSGTHNQARLEVDPMGVRVEHEVRIAEGSEGTESAEVGPALPLEDSWHRVTMVLRKVGALVEAAVSFDGAPPNQATPLPMSVPDPRVVSVKCGIPYAEKSTTEQISLKVAVDNLQGRVCTTKRR